MAGMGEKMLRWVVFQECGCSKFRSGERTAKKSTLLQLSYGRRWWSGRGANGQSWQLKWERCRWSLRIEMYPNYFAIDLQRSDYSSSLHLAVEESNVARHCCPECGSWKCLGGTTDPDLRRLLRRPLREAEQPARVFRLRGEAY